MTVSAHTTQPRSQGHPTFWGVLAIVSAVAVVALLGSLVTASSVRTWYPDVVNPSSTPPNEVFGPVWTVLYGTMAIAASIVWLSRDRVDVCNALSAFAVQLALNLAWSGLFFGLRNPLLGFLEICLLWTAVGLTVIQFFQ